MKKLCQESWQLWPSCSWSWSRWRWWCQCWNPVSAAPCTVGATSPNLPLGRQDGGDRVGGGGWWQLDWQWRWCSEPKTVWFATMRMVICVHHILEIHLPLKTRWHELTFDLFSETVAMWDREVQVNAYQVLKAAKTRNWEEERLSRGWLSRKWGFSKWAEHLLEREEDEDWILGGCLLWSRPTMCTTAERLRATLTFWSQSRGGGGES